jgi:hypothetical protein
MSLVAFFQFYLLAAVVPFRATHSSCPTNSNKRAAFDLDNQVVLVSSSKVSHKPSVASECVGLGRNKVNIAVGFCHTLALVKFPFSCI